MKRACVVFAVLLLIAAFGLPALADNAALIGTWKVVAQMPQGVASYRVEFRQNGENLTGTLFTDNGDTVPLRNVTFSDNVLKFVVAASEGDYQTESKIEGKKLKGSYVGPNSEKGTFEGTKTD